jgi:hypothetical protein
LFRMQRRKALRQAQMSVLARRWAPYCTKSFMPLLKSEWVFGSSG